MGALVAKTDPNPKLNRTQTGLMGRFRSSVPIGDSAQEHTALDTSWRVSIWPSNLFSLFVVPLRDDDDSHITISNLIL